MNFFNKDMINSYPKSVYSKAITVNCFQLIIIIPDMDTISYVSERRIRD